MDLPKTIAEAYSMELDWSRVDRCLVDWLANVASDTAIKFGVNDIGTQSVGTTADLGSPIEFVGEVR